MFISRIRTIKFIIQKRLFLVSRKKNISTVLYKERNIACRNKEMKNGKEIKNTSSEFSLLFDNFSKIGASRFQYRDILRNLNNFPRMPRFLRQTLYRANAYLDWEKTRYLARKCEIYCSSCTTRYCISESTRNRFVGDRDISSSVST